MEVALINPRTNVFEMRMIYDSHENLALALISSYLETNGYSVQLFDLRVDRTSESEVAERIVKKNIKVVALSINYVTFPSAIEIAYEIKLLNPEIIIIFGGEHVSYQDKEVLTAYANCIDYIIRGESEITFKELLEVLLRFVV